MRRRGGAISASHARNVSPNRAFSAKSAPWHRWCGSVSMAYHRSRCAMRCRGKYARSEPIAQGKKYCNRSPPYVAQKGSGAGGAVGEQGLAKVVEDGALLHSQRLDDREDAFAEATTGVAGVAEARRPPDRIEQVVPYWPSICERCQGPSPQAPQDDDPEPTWRQVAEGPLTPAVVTEHQAHGRHCPECGHCTWAEIPADVRAAPLTQHSVLGMRSQGDRPAKRAVLSQGQTPSGRI
jgi:hypothetical protein